MVGKGSCCLQVLTERKLKKELIIRIPSKKQTYIKQTIDMLEIKFGVNFKHIFKSITMDNGVEFLDQKGIEDSCLVEG